MHLVAQVIKHSSGAVNSVEKTISTDWKLDKIERVETPRAARRSLVYAYIAAVSLSAVVGWAAYDKNNSIDQATGSTLVPNSVNMLMPKPAR